MSVSSLSVGSIIMSVLKADAEVSAITATVFPVAQDSAQLPYIYYERVKLETAGTKAGLSADTATYRVSCCSKTYEEGLALAEAVRHALDYRNGAADADTGLVMRICTFIGAEAEYWDNDAYVQPLLFGIKC